MHNAADGQLEYLISTRPLAYVQDFAAALAEINALPDPDEAPDTVRDPEAPFSPTVRSRR